jgi:hypothetical protein
MPEAKVTKVVFAYKIDEYVSLKRLKTDLDSTMSDLLKK